MPEQFIIPTDTLMDWSAFIVAMGVAIVWIAKGVRPLLKPIKKIENRLTDVEEKSETCAEFFANDKRRLDEHEQILSQLSNDNKIMLESIALLMKHAETGNSTGEVSDGRDKLENYLINR